VDLGAAVSIPREKRGGLVKASSFFSSSVSSSSLLLGSASSPIDVELCHRLRVPHPPLLLSPPVGDGGAPPPLQGPIPTPEAWHMGNMASTAQIVKF
jgi:hypothetical protein